jgi:hypothetical protein
MAPESLLAAPEKRDAGGYHPPAHLGKPHRIANSVCTTLSLSLAGDILSR